ncbi:hypothetical protein PIB30_066216 [Stylosanthes scabra]|uniref:Uncharacterized protein n=1 Tax=Stylosanthes scabra TaxID=79078 RepID=A0ABU6ZKY5_9FABA|nr:hypothetical protein [Stylosanthes scabra]
MRLLPAELPADLGGTLLAELEWELRGFLSPCLGRKMLPANFLLDGNSAESFILSNTHHHSPSLTTIHRRPSPSSSPSTIALQSLETPLTLRPKSRRAVPLEVTGAKKKKQGLKGETSCKSLQALNMITEAAQMDGGILLTMGQCLKQRIIFRTLLAQQAGTGIAELIGTNTKEGFVKSCIKSDPSYFYKVRLNDLNLELLQFC